jgi:hypothetical protein
MAGSHIATTHNSKRRWASLRILSGVLTWDMLYRIWLWLGPPIHFILIPDPLHTYRKCLKAFNNGWQSYCHNTILYHHSKRGWLGFWCWWGWCCIFMTCIAAVAGAETLHICMKLTCYKYKWVGSLNLNHSNLQHDPNEKPREYPTTTFDCDCETKHLSGWCCILMTCSRSSRCWNTLYMYEEDLLWVWSVWEVL